MDEIDDRIHLDANPLMIETHAPRNALVPQKNRGENAVGLNEIVAFIRRVRNVPGGGEVGLKSWCVSEVDEVDAVMKPHAGLIVHSTGKSLCIGETVKKAGDERPHQRLSLGLWRPMKIGR